MYISAKIRPLEAYHGYDENHEAIIKNVSKEDFVEKLIRLDRVLSFTEDYIFLECPHNTVQTWHYQGGLDFIKEKLKSVGVLI
ncbi:hypothetical protein G3A39_41050 [Paraburkholderia aspalathi]|nr:hypothetical protein [Paraburkholderia aspalathi]